jgi:hypothetical protein
VFWFTRGVGKTLGIVGRIGVFMLMFALPRQERRSANAYTVGVLTLSATDAPASL